MGREEDQEMPTAELPHALAARFVALDVHRQYLVVGAVDSQQQVVLTPRRFGLAAFAEWASIHLTHADAVVFEATSNAWLLYDPLQPLVAELVQAFHRHHGVYGSPLLVAELRAEDHAQKSAPDTAFGEGCNYHTN